MTTRTLYAALVGAALALPLAAHAGDGGGSRMPAGGNLMSSYVDDPHHDPRSLWSQRNRVGQILGQPMVDERAGASSLPRRTLVSPHWAAGAAPNRRGR